MSKVTNKELIEAQRLARLGIIYAPASFLNASLEELKLVANGCGSAKGWFKPPKRIYGTLIVYACIVHDWCYEYGFTDEDKQEADRIFLNNMNRLVTRDSHKWWKPTHLQRLRARNYYRGVKYGGGEAFWEGKN